MENPMYKNIQKSNIIRVGMYYDTIKVRFKLNIIISMIQQSQRHNIQNEQAFYKPRVQADT